MLTLLTIGGIILVFVFLLPLSIIWLMYKLGDNKVFLTPIETGDIKFVVIGETLFETMINIPGKIIKDGKIEDRPENYKDGKSWIIKFIEKNTGLFFIGLNPLKKIYEFKITKEREKQKISEKDRPENWIEIEDVTVSSLRWKFPRPILVPDVEFQDGLRATLLVLCSFEVREPEIPIFILKSRFFEILKSRVQTGVNNYCQNVTLDEFTKKTDKSDGGEMSQDIILSIKERIEKEIGITINSLGIPNWGIPEDETRKLIEAEKKAQLEANAKIKSAEGQAKADEIRAKAKVADIVSLVKDLTTEGVDPNIAAQIAGGVGRADRFTSSGSKITTLVDGGGSNVSIPLPDGGGKK